jgi:hypothetical protein
MYNVIHTVVIHDYESEQVITVEKVYNVPKDDLIDFMQDNLTTFTNIQERTPQKRWIHTENTLNHWSVESSVSVVLYKDTIKNTIVIEDKNGKRHIDSKAVDNMDVITNVHVLWNAIQ